MPEPSLECALRHRIGAIALEIAFAAHAPWTILFGPSGSGKSTVLRLLAGLLKPDAGMVTMLGRVQSHREAGVFVPAHLRPMRWSGQQTALFPRMNVAQNIAFPESKSSSTSGKDLDHALDHFNLRPLANKRPYELSGGEQQRVAVVRAAFAARGKVLLLDEPFTGLDAAIRDRLIAQLRAWLADTPVLSVTHDVPEALLIGAEILRLDNGRVIAQGPASAVLQSERARLASLCK